MARDLNKFKSAIGSKSSVKQAGDGISALAKGDLPKPAQRGAAADYIQAFQNVLSNPKTANQAKMLMKKATQQ